MIARAQAARRGSEEKGTQKGEGLTCRSIHSEFQWVRCSVRPRHRNRLEISSPEQVKILDRTMSTEVCHSPSHAHLLLVRVHDISPELVRPATKFFGNDRISQYPCLLSRFLVRRPDVKEFFSATKVWYAALGRLRPLLLLSIAQGCARYPIIPYVPGWFFAIDFTLCLLIEGSIELDRLPDRLRMIFRYWRHSSPDACAKLTEGCGNLVVAAIGTVRRNYAEAIRVSPAYHCRVVIVRLLAGIHDGF